MSTSTSPPQSAIPPVPVWRMSVERYHEMIRSGALTEADRLELLDGWLVPKMTQNPPHRAVVFRTREALERRVPQGWYVDSQVPITLTGSEPEPDVLAVRGASDDFLDHHPGPGDLSLVVEVAESTLLQDRVLKKSVYAYDRIPEYWIVNLVDRRVEVYADPSGPTAEAAYRRQKNYEPGEAVPLVLDGRETAQIPVSALLP